MPQPAARFSFQQEQVEEQQEDNGQAATTTAATTNTAATSTENASSDAQAQQQQANAEEKRFTQAELDAKIKERLDREREAAKKKKEDEDAAAERTRLADEGKLKELSEKQAADITTLTATKTTLETEITGLKETVAKYEELFSKQVTAQTSALPQPVQKLLANMPLLDRMAWLTENGAELGVSIKATPTTPRGDNNGAVNEVDAYIAALNGTGQEKK